jgi:hypothetical protein
LVDSEEVVGSGNEGVETPGGEMQRMALELRERGGGSPILRERANYATRGAFVAAPTFSLS